MRKRKPSQDVLQAVQEAVRRELENSARLGHSAVISENGQLVTLTPAEIFKRLKIDISKPEQRNGC
ncbi:MAG: hypothetical protein ACJ8C4_00650 [Gemmataceae bacterium]